MSEKQISIVRANHSTENPYFLMARATAQDASLSFEARGLLAYLLSKPDDWKLTIKDLEQQCGEKRVYRILQELRAAGYIEYCRVSHGRGKWEHIYKVHELSCADFRDVKITRVKNTRVKNGDVLHIQTPQSTESTEKEKEQKEIAPAIADAPTATALEVDQAIYTPEPPKPKKERKPTPHAELFGALANAFGFDASKMTRTTRSQFGKVAGELHEVEFPPEDIPALYDYARRKAEGRYEVSVFTLAAKASEFTKWYTQWKAAEARRKSNEYVPAENPVPVEEFNAVWGKLLENFGIKDVQQ